LELWQTAVAITVTLIDVACAIHALLNKRESRAALGWFAMCLLVPLLGAILYVLFGINRVHARARRLNQEERHRPEQDDAIETDEPPEHGVPEALAQVAHLGGSLQGWPLTRGNQVTALHDGADAYPAMLEAIRTASERIYLSSYIFDPGLGFDEALIEARARGVDVRVLVDGVGELYSWPHISRRLRRAGVPCHRFNPPSLLPPSLQVNLRNHRKILVADSHTAFAGGMNIGRRHLVDEGADAPEVIDIHFRFEGPVAGQLEQAFLEDWERACGVPAPDEPRSDGTTSGESVCRVLTDGPGEEMDKLTMMLTGAVALARREILVMTPYFLPPRELLGAFVAAALRGVDVSIVLPETNNLPPVHWATRRMLWELLRRGVRVCYQPGPFVHSKLFVIDGHYLQLGSANLDPRSLRLNFELAVEVFDPAIAAAMAAHCRSARDASTEITLDTLDARPLWQKLRDSLFWLLSPYL
jgi:cardiolipin synthase